MGRWFPSKTDQFPLIHHLYAFSLYAVVMNFLLFLYMCFELLFTLNEIAFVFLPVISLPASTFLAQFYFSKNNLVIL